MVGRIAAQLVNCSVAQVRVATPLSLVDSCSPILDKQPAGLTSQCFGLAARHGLLLALFFVQRIFPRFLYLCFSPIKYILFCCFLLCLFKSCSSVQFDFGLYCILQGKMVRRSFIWSWFNEFSRIQCCV